MGDVVVGSGEIDCWREVVPVQHEDRQLTVQILFRTLKFSAAAKEYHIKLTSEEDDCFLYRTVITSEEHRRLNLSHTMNASFDQLPDYFRQLLKSVKHEGEFGERYFINVLAQNTPGLAARIELLVTMRQAGYVVQNKRLCLPFTLASDSDFKEHLLGCFDKIKKEKEQLRRSVTVLETQLREERTRSRELEDKNRWLQKELEFSQGLLKSAENIQKHYESLLIQKHRGEIGGSVLVKIEDSSVGGDTMPSVLTSSRSSQTPPASSCPADRDAIPTQHDVEEDCRPPTDGTSERVRKSPIISINDDSRPVALLSGNGSGPSQTSTSTSTADDDTREKHSPGQYSGQTLLSSSSNPTLNAPTIGSTSPCDKKTLKGAAKRKASFHNYTTNQNYSGGFVAPVVATTSSATAVGSGVASGGDVEEKPVERPPPRKYAAAMVQVDNSQLLQIRREQEQQQKKLDDDDEVEEPKRTRFSPTNVVHETAASSTSPPLAPPHPPQPTSFVERREREVSIGLPLEQNRSPPAPPLPPRPFSQPPMLLVPPATQQTAFAPPPPPPAPLASTHPIPTAVSMSGHFPSQLHSPWSFIPNSPSLPVVSSLQIPVAAAAAAAAFAGHHDFVGLGMSPYLLPTIGSVTGGVMGSVASTIASSSSFDPLAGHFEEDYSHIPDNFGRNITDSADVLNEHMSSEMSSDGWTMIPKAEPADYQDDHMSDGGSRDGGAIMTACRSGAPPAVNLMHRHLMSATTLNENSLGSRNDSPAPGPPNGSYSGSASPSLSTSSADGIDGVISYLKCLVCERSFGQEGAAAHMAQHVTDPHRCTICTEMPPFQSKEELVKHMIGHCARAYACRYCGKENPRVHYLKIHVRSHTGEKPYTCLQCGRGFADASTWRRHERVHTGEKPYECTICGRRIARRDNVKIHMRSHMRSKVQMSCRTCGKVFAQPNHLVLHERMCNGAGAGAAVGLELKPGSASSTSSADLSIVD